MSKQNQRNKSLVTVGQRIRDQRKVLKLTQKEVSIRGGFQRSYVGSVERGEKNITFLKLMKLCLALKLTMSDLLLQIESIVYEKNNL